MSLEFRPARPAEADLVDEMTLAGVATHDHARTHPRAHADLTRMIEEGTPGEVVTVAEENGRVVGFHGLVDEGDHIEMKRLFLAVECIGRGYGKAIWRHAVQTAARTHVTMRIVSDPGSRWFYEAMGAVLEREIEPYEGFVLGVYTFPLTD